MINLFQNSPLNVYQLFIFIVLYRRYPGDKVRCCVNFLQRQHVQTETRLIPEEGVLPLERQGLFRFFINDWSLAHS